MKKIFSMNNYKDKEAVFQFHSKRKGLETPVNLGIALTEAYLQHNHSERLATNDVKIFLNEEQKNYDLLNKTFITSCFQYVYGDDTLTYSDVCSMLNTSGNPLHSNERDRYYDVITAVETVITPAVTSILTGKFNEVRNIAIGDTAEFEIESNEILLANKSAEGIGFNGEQHLYKDTKTINTYNLSIAFSTPWYQVASGKVDFGKLFYKASLGFANYFAVEAYNKLVEMAAQLPAYLKYTGFTTDNIDLATMAVTGANGGARASIIGTLPALRNVLPTNDFLKMGVGEEWVKMGYIGTHAGSPLVLLDNLINPATINSNATAGTPSFMFDTDELFILPFINRRPIKTVFEGQMFSINKSSVETADKTERAKLEYKVGIDYVFDQLFGYITKD